jgi:hypothetical protein
MNQKYMLHDAGALLAALDGDTDSSDLSKLGWEPSDQTETRNKALGQQQEMGLS